MSIELAAVIRGLREELTAAVTAAKGEDLRFELGPIELEVTVAVSREAGAGAKVRFWVLEGGADGKLADTTTQRIKLTLDPKVAGAAAAPYIAGAAEPGER